METVNLDRSFGIRGTTMAVFSLICNRQEEITVPIRGWLNTYVWYNARETGIGIKLFRHAGKESHIIFTENRNSDDFVVYELEGEMFLNPPTPSEVPDSAYKARKFFAYNQLHEVSEYVINWLNERIEMDNYLNQ